MTIHFLPGINTHFAGLSVLRNLLILARMNSNRLAGLTLVIVSSVLTIEVSGQCRKNVFISFHSTNISSFARKSVVAPEVWRRTWFSDGKEDECRDARNSNVNDRALQQTAAPSSDESHELAKKLSNPVSSLISFPLQSNFDFGMGTGSGWRYTLNLQPVIPISLSPKWNLISRTIIPIIHQHNVVPNSTQIGLGDISQSLFFSPTDSKKFIWGVGPQFLIPTATDENLGTDKFGLGPTFLILKQDRGWT